MAAVTPTELSLLEGRRGAWREAGRHARMAQMVVEKAGVHEYLESVTVHVAVARVALHEGRQADARANLARTHRLRPLLDGVPWLMIQVGHELTRAHLALGDAAAARTAFDETKPMLDRNPGLGLLVEDGRELDERLAATTAPTAPGR